MGGNEITADSDRYRVLDNGAVYDMERKRIVSGAVLTSDRARELVRAREAKRIRLYAEGAGMAVEDARLLAEYGADAHIVARARTLQQIAETPDAGKAAVMAAAHLDKAQGLVADKALDYDAPPTVTHVVTLSPEAESLLRALRERANVVDGAVVDNDNDDEGTTGDGG